MNIIKKLLKSIPVKWKIAFIPLFAVFAFISIKGLDWYQQNQIEIFELNADRGTTIAQLLIQQLLLEDRYFREGSVSVYGRLITNVDKVKLLLNSARQKSNSVKMVALLDHTGRVLDNHLEVFTSAAKIVRDIKETKLQITDLYHDNEHLLTGLTDSIALEASVLMIDGIYISPVKRELLNSLKEFKGFTSESMLNINDLLYFSDELHYLDVEKSLGKKILQVIRACNGLSRFTGEASYLNGWNRIASNQRKIDHLKSQLFGF